MIQIRLFIKIDAFEPHGWSKHIVDLKLFKIQEISCQFVGLKFFTVYGLMSTIKMIESIVLQPSKK